MIRPDRTLHTTVFIKLFTVQRPHDVLIYLKFTRILCNLGARFMKSRLLLRLTRWPVTLRSRIFHSTRFKTKYKQRLFLTRAILHSRMWTLKMFL